MSCGKSNAVTARLDSKHTFPIQEMDLLRNLHQRCVQDSEAKTFDDEGAEI